MYSRFFALGAALVLGACAHVQADAPTDALPSWNDGPAKQAIVAFVKETTDQASPKFVPPAERIATFDQDGTLWVEHPMYSQVMYCLDRVPAVVKAKPELAKVEPFKTVLSGDREAIAKLSMKDLEKILAATLTGMSVDEFNAEVKKWLGRRPRIRAGSGPTPSSPISPCRKCSSTSAPTATRPTSSPAAARTSCASTRSSVYGIPPEQVVGTAGGTKYGYDKDGKPFLTKEPKLLLNDNDAGKPEGIHLMIGRRPVRRVRQLDRRPADAGVHQGGRGRAAGDAGAAR